VLAETDEQAVREANPDGVTYVLAEIWGVTEYVFCVVNDCNTDGVAEVVVDCVLETDAD
jgi:hypothetical protein